MTDSSPARHNSFNSDNGLDNSMDRDSSSSLSDEHDSDDEHVSPPPRPTGTLRVLARGNACLCCRRRKLKCDGAKPACGPCTRGRRTNECVYEEAKVKTKTQILQSRIRELEAKIRRMSEKEKELETQSSIVSLSNVPLTTSPEPSPVAQFPSASGSSSSAAALRVNTTGSVENSIFGTDAVDSIFPHATSTLDAFPNSSWASTSSTDFPYVQPDLSLDQLGDPSALWHSAPPTDASSWLTTMPTPVPSNYTVGAAPFLSAPALGTAAVSPSNLGLLAPSADASTSSISSPSISSVVSHTAVQSNVSSPPSVSWEDDLRLSALDLSRHLDLEDVPPAIAQELLHVFLQHRRQCAFEVHPGRFVASLSLPVGQRPHPALINAVYLLGCHFSKNVQLSQYEALFLTRTRRGINHALENADRLSDFLHASCLLAWYFFFKGRLLEGHYHASAAARFAISCGLHLLKAKSDGTPSTVNFFDPAAGSGDRNILAPPEDAIALAERINLFWSIFLADRTGSVGTGLPVVIRDEDIEATWPRRFEDVEMQTDFIRFESNTLRSLYEPGNPAAHVKISDSLHAIRCKAMALNERACRVASLLEADPTAVHNPDFWPQFDAIDAAIHRFVESLPPLSPVAGTLDTGNWEDEGAYDRNGQKCTISPSLVLAYTAAYGAMIHLHRMFGSNDAGSYRACLMSARRAMKTVHDINAVQARYLPMSLGIIWTSVAEVLAVEHERFRRLEAQAQLEDVETELAALFRMMRELRNVFPILTLRINKVPIFMGCQADLGGRPLLKTR